MSQYHLVLNHSVKVGKVVAAGKVVVVTEAAFCPYPYSPAVVVGSLVVETADPSAEMAMSAQE